MFTAWRRKPNPWFGNDSNTERLFFDPLCLITRSLSDQKGNLPSHEYHLKFYFCNILNDSQIFSNERIHSIPHPCKIISRNVYSVLLMRFGEYDYNSAVNVFYYYDIALPSSFQDWVDFHAAKVRGSARTPIAWVILGCCFSSGRWREYSPSGVPPIPSERRLSSVLHSMPHEIGYVPKGFAISWLKCLQMISRILREIVKEFIMREYQRSGILSKEVRNTKPN